MRRFRRDDEGVAMVVVVTLGAITMLLLTVIFTRSVSDQNQVSQQRIFEQAIHVAEAGIDDTVFRIDRVYQASKVDTYTTGDPVPPTFATAAEEEAYIRAEIDDNPVVTTGPGQFAVYKPPGVRVIYAVSWVPSKDRPTRTRFIRAEYDFAPSVPGAAIITNGDLDINGGATITGTAGSVHANEAVTKSGQSGTFSGSITAVECPYPTGVNVGQPPPVSGCGKDSIELPRIHPRDAYHLAEYVFCPNSKVFAGPKYPDPVIAARSDVVTGPCQGGGNTNQCLLPCVNPRLQGNQRFQGWSPSGNVTNLTWSYSGGGTEHGTYYAYLGHFSMNGSGGATESTPPLRITLIAESGTASTGDEPDCPHTPGGDITVIGNPFIQAYDGTGLLLYAGRDVVVGGTAVSGYNFQGLIGVHEQFRNNGNPRILGSVIINDSCDSGTVSRQNDGLNGTVYIEYNATPFPFPEQIRITRWSEL